MSLALDDFKTWLSAGIAAAAPVDVNWLPDAPDEVVAVAKLPSSGSTLFDGAFEVAHVQVRSRAATDAAAETLALEVHAFISGQEGSAAMGSSYVLSIAPVGPPAFFVRDASARTVYVATYQVTAAV